MAPTALRNIEPWSSEPSQQEQDEKDDRDQAEDSSGDCDLKQDEHNRDEDQ
jgi:hypothetical protein